MIATIARKKNFKKRFGSKIGSWQFMQKNGAGNGIEPPTRSSSGFCSTTELPRHIIDTFMCVI